MMAPSMKLLVWATIFGSDLWSLTRFLAERQRRGEDDLDVRVVLVHADAFHQEGVARLFPLDIPTVRRRRLYDFVGLPGFSPDITILDNRVPLIASSPKGFVLWHGFGWKGPNDRSEFHVLHTQLRRAFGDPLAPNPRFRWACFGPWDFAHRTEVSGFHPQNCRLVGAASHDDLREPLDKTCAQPFYPFDIVERRTVMLAPTWHYGEVFQHWGKDADLFERLFTHLRRRDVNVILRLHDSYRFEPAYRVFLSDLARRHPHVLLKFRDKNPDNFLDLQVADVLITNFSSIASLYYATLRPTLHIYPVRNADETFTWRTCTMFGVRKTEVAGARFVWKLPPEDHGGLLALDFDTLMAQLDQALDEPGCCRDQARAFLDRHMLGADGRNRERILASLRELHNTSITRSDAHGKATSYR
jgi:hypothetical protein